MQVNEFYLLMIMLCVATIIDAVRNGAISEFGLGVFATSLLGLFTAYKNGMR